MSQRRADPCRTVEVLTLLVRELQLAVNRFGLRVQAERARDRSPASQ
jgi:hypothetical protein